MNENSSKVNLFNKKNQSTYNIRKQKLCHKKVYQNITVEQRVDLLNRILSKQVTIKQAAQECNIILSTAKVILQNYRKNGQIGKKKNRQKRQRGIREDIFHQKVIILNVSKAIQKQNNEKNQRLGKMLCHYKLLNSVIEQNQSDNKNFNNKEKYCLKIETTSSIDEEPNTASPQLTSLFNYYLQISIDLQSYICPTMTTMIPMSYYHYAPQFLYPHFINIQKVSNPSFIC